MLRRSEVALVLALAVLTAVVAVAPRVNEPLARLANYEADTRDPIYDAAVDAAAIRRAAILLPERTTYFIHTAGNDPLLIGNLKAAGQLFFAPALPVVDPTAAVWILSYRAETLLPGPVNGLARRQHRLGDRIYLVELGR